MIQIQDHLKAYRDYLNLLNSPAQTQKSYLGVLKNYLEFCMNKYHLNPFQEDLLKQYLLYRFSLKLDWKTINNDYSSLKKYFTKVRELEWNVDHLPRPITQKSLPNILSLEEVERLINNTMNPKYRVFFIFLYATGMRLSEAQHFTIKDIDSDRLQVKVVKGKGKKDRLIEVPEVLIDILRAYYKLYRPTDVLFYGDNPMEMIKARTIQNTIKVSKRRAKIIHHVSPHTLRHCFATHHIEMGTNIVLLQRMLGHKNLKTTSEYLHLCVNNLGPKIYHPITGMNLTISTLKKT